MEMLQWSLRGLTNKYRALNNQCFPTIKNHLKNITHKVTIFHFCFFPCSLVLLSKCA